MSSNPLPIAEVAAKLDLDRRFLVPYGELKAKVKLEARDHARSPGRLVLVTAITPTDAGEGKTLTSISLAQGMARRGERVALALREPSLGPVFGLKGGAVGGGRAALVPAEDINLHFNGDFHAITSANNLLAAVLDNHLHHGNRRRIDVRRVLWRRVLDLNDRALRSTIVGLGGAMEGVPRETGFDITPASEIMAALCLAESPDDLRARLARIIVALDADRNAVTPEHLNVVGSLLVLLKDALLPNMVQTLEGVPAFVHGGPFANIAHGCNSVLATRMAMAHADWTITEAGFAFDLGGEKFLDIKCRSAGLTPAAVVLVATARALKLHGGARADSLTTCDVAALERGLPNLEHHIESIRRYGKEPLVAINRFESDTEEELVAIAKACERLGVPSARSEGFARGGQGAVELADRLIEHAERVPSPLCYPYELADPPKVKLEKLARAVYGASSVTYSKEADRDLAEAKRQGYELLPLCVAKTQKSISDDPSKIGRPTDFNVHIRNVLLAAGAGFLVPLSGPIMRMPGLPLVPQAEHIDLVDGQVVGMR